MYLSVRRPSSVGQEQESTAGRDVENVVVFMGGVRMRAIGWRIG
jgi:hypothetical protein